MTGILESEGDLGSVDPDVAIRLLERLQHWMELKWPKPLIGVDKGLFTPELRVSFPVFAGVKASSLIKAAIDAIKLQKETENVG